jgi:hypothetical protein
MVLARGFQHVVEPAHVDAPGGVRLFFRHRRKQGRQMVDDADVMASRHFQDLLRLGAVKVLVAAVGCKLLRHHPQIGGDDLVGAVAVPQGRDELGADLTQRAGDQNSPHVDCRAKTPGSS